MSITKDLKINAQSTAIDAIIVCIALWPVWHWLGMRYIDTSDESYGWLALGFIAIFLYKKGRGFYCKNSDYIIITLLLLIYSLFYSQIPMLLRAILTFSALAVFASRTIYNRPFNFPLWGLFMLSLPVDATLQFYIGFPLRLSSSNIAGLVLNLSNIHVQVNGGIMQFGKMAVAVDAPCSGVKMLYVTALLVCLIAVYNNLNFIRTALLALAGLLVLIFANSLRAAWLFFPESGLVFAKHKALIHDITGIIAFSIILASIYGVNLLLNQLKKPLNLLAPPKQNSHPVNLKIRILLFIICATTLMGSFRRQTHSIPKLNIAIPTTWNNKPLTQLPLTTQERTFQHNFPGVIIKATDGINSYIFRFVNTKTRKLHSATDCFKGLGYKITYQPLEQNEQGTWSVFYAHKGPYHKKIKEIIIDKSGRNWSDLSKWYWTAPNSKLWTNIVIIETI